jgi:aspartate kinase
VAILVQKYGGSSVADLTRLKRVAQKIVQTRQQGYDLVVVVSAMGDTTDELLAQARELTESPSRRELDMLLSVGERISMALLSMAIHHQGIEAISLTGSQCGIITTASHSNARIIDVRPFRVQDELARGRVVIVAGYQGTSYKREVTTLGRGGSDTTAVALAAALGAEACEIYSDVDGIFSADPRVVLDAQKLESLSHEEMLELSRTGARVLNEQAVAFAQRAKMALYARSTHLPESQGTIVRPDGFQARIDEVESQIPRAAAISHMTQGLWLTATPGATLSLLERLAPYALTVCTPLQGGGVRLFLNLENVHDLAALHKDIAAYGDQVRARDDMGMVSVIGAHIGSNPETLVMGMRALADLDAELLHVHSSRCSWSLPSSHVAQGANLLHQAFMTSATS